MAHFEAYFSRQLGFVYLFYALIFPGMASFLPISIQAATA
jgi:hypothetical protein